MGSICKHKKGVESMLKIVSIENYASIRKPINLELGRITFLTGANASGKSAICEAIQLLLDYKKAYLSDNVRYSSSKTLLQGKLIDSHKNEMVIKRFIEYDKNNVVADRLEVNGKLVNDFSSISSLFIVFLHRTYSIKELHTGEELAKFCINKLTGWDGNIDKSHFSVFSNVAKEINESSHRLIEKLRWEQDGKLYVKLWNKDYELDYSTLSTGEQGLVCAEVFLSLSQMFSQYKNVLVIFDDLPTKLVGEYFEQLVKRIDSIVSPNIQFLFTSWKEEPDTFLQADCKIFIIKEDGKTKIFDLIKRTPKGIKDIEVKIIDKYVNKEDEFINSLVIPLLHKMNFSNVKRVTHHGPGELGIDIGPFIGSGFEWRKIVVGAQVKACKFSGQSRQSINELINEVEKALYNSFYIDEFNMRVKLDYVLAIVSQHPTIEAKNTFNSAFEGNRQVVLLTPDKIAELVWKYGINV